MKTLSFYPAHSDRPRDWARDAGVAYPLPPPPPTAAELERAADDEWLARQLRLAAPDTPGSDA